MTCSTAKYVYCLFASFFFMMNVYGQSGTITLKGMITDTTGHVLKSATVALYSGKVLQKQAASTEKGFEFPRLLPGKYLLTASFAGYYTDTLYLALIGKDTVVNTRRIGLKARAIQLKEVQVKADISTVTLKGDTVVYNAAAFKTRPNSTVEELIKALPGLEVDVAGNITYRGKPIQYISVNGRQYFLNDPKQISKNLFSDMVSKVELFDAPSKESIRTGIKEPEPGKALNLVIKKGVSLAINGKVYGGSTEKGNYTAGGNASSFVNDRAIIANINTNNISDLYTGQDGLNEAPTGVQGRSTITGSGLTYSDKLSKLLSLNMIVGSKFSNRKYITSGNRQTFYGGDSTQMQLNNGTSVGSGNNHSLNGEVLLALDSLSSGIISYKPNFNFGENKSVSSNSTNQYIQNMGASYLTSAGTTNNISNDHSINIANELDFIKNMKKRTFVINFNQNYFRNISDGHLNTDTRFYGSDGALLRDNQVKQQSKQVSRSSDYKINLTDDEKITPFQTISLTYAIAAHHDEIKRAGYDFNAATNSYDLVDTLTTNDLKNISTTQNVNLSYSYNKGNLNYKIGGGLQHSLLESEDFIKVNVLKKGFLDWTGSTSLNYKLKGKTDHKKPLSGTEVVTVPVNVVNKNISLNYNISSQSPNLYQWRPLPDVSDPLFIRSGNPGLKPEQDHDLGLIYYSTNFKKGKSFQLTLSGRYRISAIVQAIDLLPGGVQRSGYVNANGLYNGTVSLTFELPMGNVKNGKVRMTNTAGYQRDMSLVNGGKNTKAGLNVGQRFNALYRTGAKLELNVDGSWMYDGSRYSLQPDQKTTSLIQNYRAGFSYELPGDTRISSYYSINFLGAQAGLAATHTMVWNAALVKNVFKDRRGEFRFSVFDLLSSNNGLSQGAYGNSVFRSETNTPGRQLLLTFAWYIRPNQKQ